MAVTLAVALDEANRWIEFAITEKQEDGRFVDADCEHEFCEADQVIICAGQLSRFNLNSKGESNDMRDHVGLAADAIHRFLSENK